MRASSAQARPATAALLLALTLGPALAACSSSGQPGQARGPAAGTPPASGPTASPATSAVPATNWLQYHANAARTGAVPGLPAAGRLSLAWSRRLDSAVYGQPLVIGGTVIAATEADEVYGLDLATGAVRWHTRVGRPAAAGEQPCGDISPLGITSTPVYDPRTRLVYVVAQDGRSGHVMAGLRVPDGHVRVRMMVPSPDHQPFYDQQRGALALYGSHIYVAFGGHDGDCGPYRGAVVAMPASGHGPIWHYLVPTGREGGIWASGGPVAGPGGTIYISTGNGAVASTRYDGSDSVTALTPALRPLGSFAPADWRTLSAADEAAVSGETVYVPCMTGLAAVDTARDRVRVRWRGPAGVSGSPVIGGGAVWVASPDTGVLYELAPRTGRVLARINLASQLPHFVSPALSGGLVLVGTMTGVTALSGG